jgi:hypothetical protein
MSAPDFQALADAIIGALATAPEGMSSARLSKRLNVRMSTLLRCIAWLGEETIAGQPGLGWVRVIQDGQDGDRTLLTLTDKPRTYVPPEPAPADSTPAAPCAATVSN